ncbi:unnamed protein product, partial [Meganyctiphanes norvegica]
MIYGTVYCQHFAERRFYHYQIESYAGRFYVKHCEVTERLHNSLVDPAARVWSIMLGVKNAASIWNRDIVIFTEVQEITGASTRKYLTKTTDYICPTKKHRKNLCQRLLRNKTSIEGGLFKSKKQKSKFGWHYLLPETRNIVHKTMNDGTNSDVVVRYFYITFLRNPIHRYLSEFRHVRRGATWKTARLWCMGRPASEEEIPRCYKGETWENLTLEEFINCPSNLAINRQTRMLADMSLVGCYNQSFMSPVERNTAMLLSAKNNLKKMAFFGLTEEQEKSQYLFEETFNLKFNVRFEQYNQTISGSSLHDIPVDVVEHIKQMNNLDIQLYEYAQKLLQSRFKIVSSEDDSFQQHFSKMGNTKLFSWDDIENDE